MAATTDGIIMEAPSTDYTNNTNTNTNRTSPALMMMTTDADASHPKGSGLLTSCFCFSSSNRKKSIEFLIAKRRWTALSTRLDNLQGNEMENLMNIHNTGETILSLACRFCPSEDIIQQITDLFPMAVEMKTSNQQYPLHIACSYGALPMVISHLCKLFPEAAGRGDNLGRTPLHLVCSDYSRTYKVGRKPLMMLDEAMYQVIRELIIASPNTVAQEDYDRTSALEYGISANVDIRVINSIQKACERFYKSQSERLRQVDPLIKSVSLTPKNSTMTTTTTRSSTHGSSSNTGGRIQKMKQTSMTSDSVETAISSDGQLHSPTHTKEDGDPSSGDSHATPNQDDDHQNDPSPSSSVPTRISLDEMRLFLDGQ